MSYHGKIMNLPEPGARIMPLSYSNGFRRARHAAAELALAADREIERLQEKISGLEADLAAAVSVARDHGASAWAAVNYPHDKEPLIDA